VRSLSGVKLVISDSHKGFTDAIRQMVEGRCWQLYRVDLPATCSEATPSAHQGIITAALRSEDVYPEEGRRH